MLAWTSRPAHRPRPKRTTRATHGDEKEDCRAAPRREEEAFRLEEEIGVCRPQQRWRQDEVDDHRDPIDREADLPRRVRSRACDDDEGAAVLSDRSAGSQ